MWRRPTAAALACAALLACGGAKPRPPAPPPALTGEAHDVHADEAQEPAAEAAPPPEAASPAPSASYEDALSKPEPLDVNDDRAHLTDAQLRAPVQGVFATCRVPWNVKVTLKTAVQYGRAIGVTVDVRIERRKPKRPPSKAALKAQAKADAKLSARIVTCIDHAVRSASWPPSKRRDSFTTQF